MTDQVFRVPVLFDYIATFTWAVSGAIVAIRRRYDVTGVFVMALISSTGGSLVRDAIFLQRTPPLLSNPLYIPLIAAATLLTAMFRRSLGRVVKPETIRKFVDVIDGLGIPAFACVGMQLAEERGIPIFGVFFVGVANGLAGGLLRDVVVREVPALLRPGQFVSAMLVLVCGLFLLLTQRYGVNPTAAAATTIVAFFILRLLAVRFNWKTRPVLDEDTDESHGTIPR
jgi:uncharacterized membrane protein YeiH